MRRLRFLPALLMILSACSESIIEQNPSGSDQMGSVSISLSTDMRDEAVVSKAGAEEPVLNDFRVAIYKVETRMRLYNDSYANTVGKEIKLNEGDYRLVAQHGDSLGCGFNKPYYMADPTFTVKERNTQVKAVAKLSNVRLAVEYDATIADAYPDYYTIVRHKKYSDKKVKFVKGETRYGYIPGGDLILEIWALDNGVWKTYQTSPATYSPNDFVTFTITTDDSEGNLVIDIKVDNTVEDKNETIEIPSTTVPQEAPSITLAGFDGTGNVHEFVEGVEDGANAMANFVARASIAKAVLDINSEYLTEKGVPSEVDFANLSSSDKALLKSVGFSWDENMATSRKLSYIDFSGVISKMLASVRSAAQDETVAEFILKVEDAVGKKAMSNFKIVSGAVKPVVSVEDYNIWASKVVSPAVTLNKGNVNLVKLQSSVDGNTWNDINDTPVQDQYTLTYGTIPAEPGTTYYVRAVYNDNEACVSPVLTIRTESPEQVENSGFEEWNTRDWNFNHNGSLGGQSSPMKYYKPWASSESDTWWDSNTTNSLRSSLSIGYTYFKTFPLVHYSTDAHSGTKSAQLTVANVGNSNSMIATTGSWYVGELFIGKGNDGSDGGWSKTTDGHTFPSRPESMTFWYEYAPYTSSHTFSVEIAVLSADNTVIGSGSATPGKQSSWTSVTVPVTYSVTDKKAASIRISFKASAASDFSCSVGGEYIEIAGSKNEGDKYRIKLNATLRIDDIKLNY